MSDQPIVANVTQTFYDRMAAQYDKFYQDWDQATRQEAAFLKSIFDAHGFDLTSRILDCACGIGTQAIGLAKLDYSVTASDISKGELKEAEKRASARGVSVDFRQADFRKLSAAFPEPFDLIICMDNALPHMLTPEDLEQAVQSITAQLRKGGLFVASIRDYDLMLEEKPNFSAPYVHKTEKGQRVLFQTWDWQGDNYRFIQYIIDDEATTTVSRFECEYRATRRSELTSLLESCGCAVQWKMPEETGFYQPIVIAKKAE